MAAGRALARNDVRGIARDPLLSSLLLLPPALILGIRVAAPRLMAWLQAAHGFDATPYLPWALSALFLLNTPVMLVGGVFGLMLLDERDDGTLTALRVTPLGLRGYLAYRLAGAAVLGLGSAVGGMALTGLAPPGSIGAIAWVALPTSLLAAGCTVMVAVIADNKVEGLAVMKGASFVLAAPLLAWFIDSRWTALLGVIPTYWPLKGFWEGADGGSAWSYALIGTAYATGVLALLLRRLDAKVGAGEA
ncbi:MAG TPA: hypothetical protein VML96_06315 [Egibacteraceae bacterium]|nr:hypothetical protein [Egibacteraceae bacterium]